MVSGALICFLAVLFGAFGAHLLADTLSENQRESVFDLASRYQFYHGLALLAFGAVQLSRPSLSANGMLIFTWLMVAGVVVFCGSLYALALSNVALFGAITPIGGSLLLLAWGGLIWRFYHHFGR